jgi:hypothetical protein
MTSVGSGGKISRGLDLFSAERDPPAFRATCDLANLGPIPSRVSTRRIVDSYVTCLHTYVDCIKV